MNKTLSLACRKIPYIPELRSLCSSVTGCLQLVQMEYWFSKNPHGFYKFLSPCDHEKYRDGDSWTEELGFSEHEFRAAFEVNGVSYTRKDFVASLQEGSDPFQAKLYCRVYDSKTGLTYYFRNHTVMDTVLNNMFTSSSSQVALIPSMTGNVSMGINISEEILNGLSSEMKSFYLRILKILRSEVKNSDLYNKEHKITARDDNKKAAAKQSRDLDKNTRPMVLQEISAAAFFEQEENIGSNLQELAKPLLSTSCHDAWHLDAGALEKQEPPVSQIMPEEKITDPLTTAQHQHVRQVAKEYSQQYGKQLGNKNEKNLYDEICCDLLNPKSWTLCGNDFLRKLNVIKKHIREGRWGIVTPLVRESTSGEPIALAGAYSTEILVLAEQYLTLLREAEDCYYFLKGTVAERDEFVKRKEQDRMKKILQETPPVQQALRAYGVLEAIESNFPLNLKAFTPQANQSTKTKEALSC
jgi:hypothetical protein